MTLRLCLITLFAATCLPLGLFAAITPNEAEEAKYRELYPLFMEGCSSGRRVDKDGSFTGRAWGHGSVFIKGATVDSTKSYPQLKVQLTGDNEIGVSADGQFGNINWVAVPNANLFYYGDLPKNQILTKDVREALIHRMIQEGWFKAAKSERYKDKSEEEQEHLIVNEAIPIDVAVAWARETYCQRVPMTPKQLENVVAYFNEVNKFYFEEGHKYTWDFLSNSCGHTAHNAFAAAGVHREHKIDRSGVSKISEVVIPSHFFLATLRETAYREFPTFTQLLRNSQFLETFVEYDVIPNQDGSLLRYYPVHGLGKEELNEIYDPSESITQFIGLDLIPGLDLDWFAPKLRMLKTARKKAQYHDLKSNLEYYLKVYKRALSDAEKINLDQLVKDLKDKVNRDEHPEVRHSVKKVHAQYVAYLKNKIQEMVAKLTKI